jgi:flagellar protein FlbD
MIRLTHINHRALVLNAELIEYVETTPDRVVSMTTGEKFVVVESADEIVDRGIEYRRAILEGRG